MVTVAVTRNLDYSKLILIRYAITITSVSITVTVAVTGKFHRTCVTVMVHYYGYKYNYFDMVTSTTIMSVWISQCFKPSQFRSVI